MRIGDDAVGSRARPSRQSRHPGITWRRSASPTSARPPRSRNARVAYLTLEGDFVTSKQFRGNANDVALHPELGLLVAGDAFPDHYLSRLTPTGETAFGPIPPELVVDHEGLFRLPSNLVAVTPDGLIHVLDGNQLALVSYLPDGELVGVAFLPKRMRVRELREQQETIEAFGGPTRVLGAPIVSTLRPSPDGRLFARHTSESLNAGRPRRPGGTVAAPGWHLP